MKKALIICNAGMSSSLMAKKATDFFKAKDVPIELDATTVSKSQEFFKKGEFDLYLVSPQIKMYYDQIAKEADAANKLVANIPPQAYIPTEDGVSNLAKLTFTELKPLLQAEKNG